MKILVCNAGSTSLKFKLFDMPEEKVLAVCKIERVGTNDGIFHYENRQNGEKLYFDSVDVPDYASGIRLFLVYLLGEKTGVIDDISQIERVGFKTVLSKGHYGIHELSGEVLEGMRQFMTVAPAHNGPYLEAISQLRSVLPKTKFIGAFETAFHETIPMHRKLYGVPYEWYEKYGVQKFGYHGASHSYIASEVAKRRGGSTGRLVSCHLGGSSSLCAIDDGVSVDTSFGFSLQIGVVQTNRVGDMDPFIIPYMMQQGLSVDEICRQLCKESGMKTLSQTSGDMRYVLEAAESGSDRARLALDVYCDGIVKYIGAFAAEMGGLDAVAFTAGVGENTPYVRSYVCNALSFLGVELSDEKNGNLPGDGCITADSSRVKVYVIPTDEEVVVARKTYQY